MTPFTTLTAVAAPMPGADIDTDIIFPARFLLLTQKAGLGRYAFHDQRLDADGTERPDFVLHQPRWRGAQILVAGANFGCGSSREQAPWALADLGLRCIIAPGFGEIFEANCLNNGLLPLRLAAADHALVLAAAQAGLVITVSLPGCTVTCPGSPPIGFQIAERARQALMAGQDAIARILLDDGAAITAFEQHQRSAQPWLYAADAPPPA